MNYSRRQLEALGEPLGESVTRTKPGGRIYGGGDSQPTSMTQTSLSYAPEVQPAINEIFSGAMELAKQPYERYQYNRIAGFDPMQLQAQQAAANMRVSPYLGQASGIAGNVANRAMNMNYDPTRFMEERVRTGQFTDPNVAGRYMSPYMQNVVDIGKREAARQDAIAGNQRAAQAVGAGAFGGSRQAIMEAEAQRNLAQQMGDIQAKGSQAAYEQAAQQFQQDQARMLQASMANQAKNLEAQQLSEQSRQYGADLGLRGLQTALQGSGQLGQFANTQFGQAKDIIGMQATAGAERQNQEQRRLTQHYEDFLRQKQDPYTRYAYLMEMARGMPMTQTQQIYAAPPSAASQAAGYGGLAYGLSRLASPPMANGGLAGLAINNLTRG